MKDWVPVAFIAAVGLFLLVGTCAHADEIPDVRKIDVNAMPAWDTLEEAGVQAIAHSLKCSTIYECGGPIAQRPDGKFVFGGTHTNYSGDSLEVSDIVPPGWKLVADYHTHPCLPHSHYPSYFSDADVQGNITRHTIGILGDLCSGDVHFYDPRTMPPNVEEVEDGVWLTHGKIIGHVEFKGPSLEAFQTK